MDLKRFNDIFASGEENLHGSLDIRKVNEQAAPLSPIEQAVNENTLDEN
jgi:hypothetical protein